MARIQHMEYIIKLWTCMSSLSKKGPLPQKSVRFVQGANNYNDTQQNAKRWRKEKISIKDCRRRTNLFLVLPSILNFYLRQDACYFCCCSYSRILHQIINSNPRSSKSLTIISRIFLISTFLVLLTFLAALWMFQDPKRSQTSVKGFSLKFINP